MGPVETLLRKAGELITRGHTQGTFARALGGACVDEKSPYAIQWCALGALRAAVPEDWRESRDYLTAASLLESQCGSYSLSQVNDEKPERIVDMFSEAIEAAAELGL